MKRLAFSLLSIMLLSLAAINASAQETRQVSGFDAVATAGSFNVYIKMDGTESVKVDADASIISEIETVVEGHTLKIRFKDHRGRNNYNYKKADVYVSAKSLNALTNSGSGSMKVDGTISTNDFKVVLSGSGDIRTSVKSDALNAIISGSGSIKLSGSTGDANFTISGSGQIQGKELKTVNTSAGITGSGDVFVAVEKRVTAHITGSGNVTYTGSADVVNPSYTGSGRVNKAN
jgi:hypothetical protein